MTHTVKKIHEGETYEKTDGREYMKMSGGSTWAVLNEAGQVVETYSAKYIAEYEAERK